MLNRSASVALRPSARLLTAASKQRLVIFDTTLRDGEQSPGATLTLHEKLQIARQLSLLGVDVCEAGFPIASNGDFEAVKRIAEEVGPMMDTRDRPMIIAGLSRANVKDIQRCYDAVKYAPKHRIHTFIATSDIHLQYKLKMSREECIERAVKAVEFAANLTEDVEFSTEDAGRSDPKFLVEILKEVIRAGATTLNIPDTVGYATPEEYGNLIKYLIENVDGSEKAIFSTHCHNDLGLATANSLCAVQKGARQVEVAVNGIGERAGNTSLEEIVMTLKTRPNLYPVYTTVNAEHIMKTSRMVSSFTGMLVQPNKAIVGANAFAHEAGIHQDGVLKHRETYEIMTPESIGLSSNSLVLGKHSGKHAYKDRLKSMGYAVTDEELVKLVGIFKAIADEKKTVTEADIEAIMHREYGIVSQPEWKLKNIHVTAGCSLIPTATVTMQSANGTLYSIAKTGDGPVHASYRAIEEITGTSIQLHDFHIQNVTEGIESLAKVSVNINTEDSKQINGIGANTDIIVAAADAYVNAINKLIAKDKHRIQMKPSVNVSPEL